MRARDAQTATPSTPKTPRNRPESCAFSRILISGAHQAPVRWRHHARTPPYSSSDGPVLGAMLTLAAPRAPSPITATGEGGHASGAPARQPVPTCSNLFQPVPTCSNLFKPVPTRPTRARRRKTNPEHATQCNQMQPTPTLQNEPKFHPVTPLPPPVPRVANFQTNPLPLSHLLPIRVHPCPSVANSLPPPPAGAKRTHTPTRLRNIPPSPTPLFPVNQPL
jgi:hypothetical protein